MDVDISELLVKYKDKITYDKSVLKVAPSSIDSMYGSSKDIKMIQFRIFNFIYAEPLVVLVNQLTKKKKNPLQNININLLSVEDRVTVLKKTLLKLHVKQKMLDDIIPSREEDVQILFEAAKNGYPLAIDESQILAVFNRVDHATMYLNYIKSEAYQKSLKYDN